MKQHSVNQLTYFIARPFGSQRCWYRLGSMGLANGSVAEWPKAVVLKTTDVKASASSNLAASSLDKNRRRKYGQCMTNKDVDYERIVREIKLARHQQKKRMYEQAKRQRKAESKIVAASKGKNK